MKNHELQGKSCKVRKPVGEFAGGVSVHQLLRYLLLLVAALFLPELKAASADDLVEGERIYQIHCASCHGSKGEGSRGSALAVPKLARAETEEALSTIITRGIPGTEMLATRLRPEQVRSVAAWVRKLGQTPPPQIVGDVRRGEQLYLTKGNCAACHAIKARGGVSGPDLTEIGLRRGAEYLRRALLEPEAEVPENFAQWRWHTVIPDNYLQVRVVTKDGQRVTGVRLNEDMFYLQLRDLTGRVRSFDKAELKELRKDWGKSPMPSYRDVYTPEEINHLIAFLLTLRGEK
jgi:putative heme-binding domain-containing protein